MEQSNTTKLQGHLRWALEELDRYVTIGGDGIARNRCEGQVVDGYIEAYSAAKKSLQLNPLLEGFNPNRPITPLEKLKAAVCHMTDEEHAEIAEEAYRIVQRADREMRRYQQKTE